MQSINSKTSNGATPFEHGAISEEELDQVVGGLARAWVEPLAPAPARVETPGSTAAWDSAAGRLEA